MVKEDLLPWKITVSLHTVVWNCHDKNNTKTNDYDIYTYS